MRVYKCLRYPSSHLADCLAGCTGKTPVTVSAVERYLEQHRLPEKLKQQQSALNKLTSTFGGVFQTRV